jgi:hypothetical protein
MWLTEWNQLDIKLDLVQNTLSESLVYLMVDPNWEGVAEIKARISTGREVTPTIIQQHLFSNKEKVYPAELGGLSAGCIYTESRPHEKTGVGRHTIIASLHDQERGRADSQEPKEYDLFHLPAERHSLLNLTEMAMHHLNAIKLAQRKYNSHNASGCH